MASSGAAWPILSAAAQEEEAEAVAERRVGQSVGRRHAKLSTQSRLKQQLARSLAQCVQPTTRERSRKKEREEKWGRRNGRIVVAPLLSLRKSEATAAAEVERRVAEEYVVKM